MWAIVFETTIANLLRAEVRALGFLEVRIVIWVGFLSISVCFLVSFPTVDILAAFVVVFPKSCTEAFKDDVVPVGFRHYTHPTHLFPIVTFPCVWVI